MNGFAIPSLIKSDVNRFVELEEINRVAWGISIHSNKAELKLDSSTERFVEGWEIGMKMRKGIPYA